ncbi:ornithine cyclodeaminase [Novosphingobium chloroacetimidivorans]|uniref:Ornithine cyclodeaminase n=1 Tax=Novosphingobium chloroacetimidivorans TaxID=1428314 RepID=A0A7W7K852_9SPHN|nr:ornithine cyclodeaminase family protein [Novosphingobium chloroacetimidivorans]MBB4857951.1 ornithine cyclodeaminase [Novosphingobium chloroacetimidivorans]
MEIAYYDAEAVEKALDYQTCVGVLREAMQVLSTRHAVQPLRQIIELEEQGLFAIMPGALDRARGFGAKLVSVFADKERQGRSRHRGVIAVFSGETGAIECLADAEAVTTLRTASASALATATLARGDAQVLTVMGTGTQARAHVLAHRHVGNFAEVRIWGRTFPHAQSLAERLTGELGRPVIALADARTAVRDADVICTTTSAAEPILLGEWVRPGTHVNLVGSSFLGPVEADSALVVASRYFADYRPSALVQASELAVAREAGLVDDAHVVGEIGEVLAGMVAGRQSPEQITLYKSLGHVVQDLAAAAHVHRAHAQIEEPA